MTVTVSSGLVTILFITLVYVYLWKREETDSINGLTAWLAISVALALIPLVFNAMVVFLAGSTPSYEDLLSKGELFIVSLAVGLEAVGKLFGSGLTKKPLKILAGGGCIFLTTLSALLFSITSRRLVPSFDISRVAHSSSILFFLTILAGGSCALLAEVKK
jgi:hypothetical protein